MIDQLAFTALREVLRVHKPRLAFGEDGDVDSAPLPALAGSDFLLLVRKPSRMMPRRDSGSRLPVPTAKATIYAVTGGNCTAIELEQPGCHPLLNALPDQIAIGGDAFAEPSPLRRLLELLAAEARVAESPCEAVLDALAAALFAMVLRHHIATCDAPPHGIFAALSDARLQPVLSAMHANPARAWRLKELAGIASMSSSAFVRHFRHVLGMSPYSYLVRWRMMRADTLLREVANCSVAHVADVLGYSTEAAFRRTFKRFFGFGPGAVRRKRNAIEGREILGDGRHHFARTRTPYVRGSPSSDNRPPACNSGTKL